MRLCKPERLGIGPEREFDLKLRTLSWSNWFKLLESSEPVRLRYSRTSLDTLPLRHSLTPSQLQRSVPRHWMELDGSIEDFKVSRDSTSLDLARESKQKKEAKTRNNVDGDDEEETMMNGIKSKVKKESEMKYTGRIEFP